MIPAASAQPSPFLWIPYSQNPMQALSNILLDQHGDKLPNLSSIVILLHEPQAARSLRACLLDQARARNFPALLAPTIETLADFVAARSHIDADKSFCDHACRELILIEALQQYSGILGNSNPWVLAEHLLSLFDELTLSQQHLPETLQDFTNWLQRNYRIEGQFISAQSREAELIHTLWLAWHAELEQRQYLDKTIAYTQDLKADLELDQLDAVYYVGSIAPSRAELHWLQRHLSTGKLTVCLHGHVDAKANAIHPSSPLRQFAAVLLAPIATSTTTTAYSETLDQVYAEHYDVLLTRTQQQADKYTSSPLQDRLSIFLANNAEQEARAVDIQIRQWLLQGKTNIAVVCENRRLSRRLRAMLERANVTLQDTTGWALSTTSASAMLERWLECIEEDFAYAPLLDLLSSAFVFSHYEAAQYKKLIFRFEQDIIQNENIARNLNRYRDHIRDRSQRVDAWRSGLATELLALLDQLEKAANPLLKILQGRHLANIFLSVLLQSLQLLQADEALSSDDAGCQLMQELEQLQQSALQVPLLMDWSTFRTWLGRHLEQSHFRPAGNGNAVRLMGLAQTQWQSFDALIIAGAEQRYLPGAGHSSPFFNESVRQELGLTTRASHIAERFYHFRRLLESAPHIVITACDEHNGEPIAISPWLERLLAFHELAWGSRLQNEHLAQLSLLATSQISVDTPVALPPIPQPAAVVLPANKLPEKFSASDYQCLLECPYQYFAARSLSLSASEEVRLALSKADYGSRIHQCLDALHTDRRDLPGPFKQAFDEEHRQAAIDMLNQISTAVFAQDLQDHFSHQGWLQKWQSQIPSYIDWEIKRARLWQVAKTEASYESSTAGGITLRGQVDRLEKHGDEYAVIDYKTGNLPKMDEVESGEKIQLPFYTLLTRDTSPVSQVSYLGLDPVSKKESVLSGENLQTLAIDIQQRLDTMVEDMQQGIPLPAWGDSKACSYCDMNRLCRRSVWENTLQGMNRES